jgi:hypothetical protein
MSSASCSPAKMDGLKTELRPPIPLTFSSLTEAERDNACRESVIRTNSEEKPNVRHCTNTGVLLDLDVRLSRSPNADLPQDPLLMLRRDLNEASGYARRRSMLVYENRQPLRTPTCAAARANVVANH